jgi:hypothetical protein
VHTEIETETAVPQPRAAAGAARARLAAVFGERATRRLVRAVSRNSRAKVVEPTASPTSPATPVPGTREQSAAQKRGAGIPGYLAERFRLPTPDDSAPEQRRLIGVCAWAGLLGIGGVTIALRVLLTLFQVDSGWYAMKASAIGLVGLLFTVASFASVHRPVLPWSMLSCATTALAGAIVLTALD